MLPQLAYLVLSTLALTSDAAPRSLHMFAPRQLNTTPAVIAQKDTDPQARAAAVAARRDGFQYGPSLIGDASFFPSGPLGDARKAQDLALWDVDRKVIEGDIAKDVAAVKDAIKANGGLNSLEDYANVLYKNKWNNTIPARAAPGIMTNYTQDLLFSMERLSQNPYPVQLVKKSDSLPFQVSRDILQKVAGVSSLEQLRASGRLFVVDHSYQANYTKTEKFGAACTALFFIHPKSGDFLPLAIKTNVGSDLIYTPADTPTDWLLAKMMFNVNDFFHAEMFHLVVSHDVGEAVHEAAMRTLSENHPVMIVLERLMHQAYSARPVGEELCFNPGGHWDQNFLISEKGCRQFVTDFWPTKGAYQAGYLENDLKSRGLIDNSRKHKFKSFPYLADTLEIHDAFRKFFTAFVNSYYPTDAVVSADFELRNWFAEATSGAKVIDFPGKATKKTLVEVLTHFAFINGVAHHALNGGDPVSSKATLPFHLNAMYAPVPTAKNVTDLVPFLPPPDNAVAYIMFLATFNRPFYEAQNRTLAYAFSDEKVLNRLSKQTGAAAATFLGSMKALSKKIRARTFDKNGLSEGMPFVWKTLDPGSIPFFFAV